MSFYLDFEKYRHGGLVSKHWEHAHSWTWWAWRELIRYFMLHSLQDVSGSLFQGGAGNHDRGIVVGDSDVAFDFFQKGLQNQLIIQADETDQEDYELQYLDSTYTMTYDATNYKWQVEIKRGFYMISSNLGGKDVTIREIGLYPDAGPAWARDVLASAITITPLDTLYITYNIDTDLSSIDA